MTGLSQYVALELREISRRQIEIRVLPGTRCASTAHRVPVGDAEGERTLGSGQSLGISGALHPRTPLAECIDEVEAAVQRHEPSCSS